jgi:hypothetical protein
MVAYIGRWDEPEPSDQTDLSNGGDWTSMAVENRPSEVRLTRGSLRSADLGWGQPTCSYGKWAPPSVARLLVSCRFFNLVLMQN